MCLAVPAKITEIEGTRAMVDMAPTIRQIVEDLRRGVPSGTIARRFHNTVAGMIAAICQTLRGETGINAVALSGGVFQNMVLLGRTHTLLVEQGFEVFTHHQVPPNDGGVSLGQAVIANWVMSDR